MICPRHHYLRKNQCVPLFDILSGLDLNLKIQITPDREISNAIAAEFEGLLNDTVNYIFKKSFSLQVRDIFLLYLQNKQRNRKKYYVFNIYLYSSTGKIKFSQAIMETKTFFTGMKSRILPPLSNGITVRLKVEFAHKIRTGFQAFLDLSNGRSLTLSMKDAWKRRIQRPNLEISDIHWCYRAGFNEKDFKVMGLMVHEINPSVTVYGTEFDIGIDPDDHDVNVYICIDLVVTRTNREDVRSTRNTDRTLDKIIDDEAEKVSDKGMVLMVCLVVAVVLGILFCKIRVVAKRKLNTVLSTKQSTADFDKNNAIPEQIECNIKHDMNPDERKDELESYLCTNNMTNGQKHGVLLDPTNLNMTSNRFKNDDKTFGDRRFETQGLTSIADESSVTIASIQWGDKRTLTKEDNSSACQTTVVTDSNPTDNHHSSTINPDSTDDSYNLTIDSKPNDDQHSKTLDSNPADNDQHPKAIDFIPIDDQYSKTIDSNPKDDRCFKPIG